MRDKSTRKAPQHNVACTNFLKVSASKGCGGLQAEMEERLGENTPNIDPERTKLNLYFLPDPKDREKFIVQKEKPDTSLEDRVYARINEVGATVKKDKTSSSEPGRKKNPRDSIIMENIIFQVSHERAMEILAEDDMLDENGKIRLDKEFSMESKTMRMFLDTYQFAMDRYGAENVIGAYLHLDEYTPHMHLQVVPVEMRQVKYRGELLYNKDGSPRMKGFLNNKELFGKEEYKSIWSDYAEAIKDYGVIAAEGLIPKGEYEAEATMNAVYERQEEEKEELRRLEIEKDEIEKEKADKEKTLKLVEKFYNRNMGKLVDILTEGTITSLKDVMFAILAELVKEDLNGELREYNKLQNGDIYLRVINHGRDFSLRVSSKDNNVYYLGGQRDGELIPNIKGLRINYFFNVVKNADVLQDLKETIIKRISIQGKMRASNSAPSQVRRGGGRPPKDDKNKIYFGGSSWVNTGSGSSEEEESQYDESIRKGEEERAKNRGPKL